ncbi:hypothetical protein ACFL0L_04115 [Patescibacteria group bacterium]
MEEQPQQGPHTATKTKPTVWVYISILITMIAAITLAFSIMVGLLEKL